MTDMPVPHDAFTLAACAEMLWTDLPIEDRIERIGERGLRAELWSWQDKDLERIAAVGVPIESMTGYTQGELIDPDGAARLLESARWSLSAAERLDCPRLNVHGTGLGPDGLPVRPQATVSGTDWVAAARTLERLGELGAEAGQTFTLENLNLIVDHPGTPFGLGRDALALVRAVDHPNVRLNLDLYHLQIGEGNLIEFVEEALPWVGEIQVADVPGRCEPGTGEIHYPAVAAALHRLGYEGTVAMEAYAASDPEVALRRFADACSV